MSNFLPMNALRVFDAVARQGSMAKAAAELHISPSSVTHHIRKLEEALGIKLITRTTNSITLTAEGAQFAAKVCPAFDTIMAAAGSLIDNEVEEPLRISCVPTLGNKWLATQLAELEAAFPGLHVHCDFSPIPVNFDQNPVDLAIRYGNGNYSDADTQLLFVDKVAPVCSPETAKLIKSPEDLFGVTLLPNVEKSRDGHSLWYYWAEAFLGQNFAKRIDIVDGPIFKSARFVVESLQVSRSVTVLDYTTVREAFRRGNLVSPFEAWVDAPNEYYLLTPKRRIQRAETKHLKTLLKRSVGDLKRTSVS